MEKSESDRQQFEEFARQQFEEFARDLDLSDVDIKEIENNEEFKECLFELLCLIPVVVDNKFRGDNKFLFWANYDPDFIPVRRLFNRASGLSSSGLCQKILGGYPDDLAKWLDPVYWQDDLDRRDSILRGYSWEQLRKYEWADKQGYDRATAVKPAFEPLVWLIMSAIISIFGGAMVAGCIARGLGTHGGDGGQLSWYASVWALASGYIISFITCLFAFYFDYSKQLRLYKRAISLKTNTVN
jgi:hypothetical protein